jgi:hypothetical protein
MPRNSTNGNRSGRRPFTLSPEGWRAPFLQPTPIAHPTQPACPPTPRSYVVGASFYPEPGRAARHLAPTSPSSPSFRTDVTSRCIPAPCQCKASVPQGRVRPPRSLLGVDLRSPFSFSHTASSLPSFCFCLLVSLPYPLFRQRYNSTGNIILDILCILMVIFPMKLALQPALRRHYSPRSHRPDISVPASRHPNFPTLQPVKALSPLESTLTRSAHTCPNLQQITPVESIANSLSPLDPTLTKNAPVSPLESTLTESDSWKSHGIILLQKRG